MVQQIYHFETAKSIHLALFVRKVWFLNKQHNNPGAMKNLQWQTSNHRPNCKNNYCVMKTLGLVLGYAADYFMIKSCLVLKHIWLTYTASLFKWGIYIE